VFHRFCFFIKFQELFDFLSFLWWPINHGAMYCSVSKCLSIFCFLLLLSSSFILLWSDSMQGVISIFLNLLRLALCPKIWSFWRKFHGLLRRIYIQVITYMCVCVCVWIYMYVCVYIRHNETPCIAILNKNVFFQRTGRYQWEGVGFKERV
jgi:hypothetical protein